MGYLTPADVTVSDTWAGHRGRNPPSSEPGTDYATAYGTNIRAAETGTVSVVDNSNGGGEGRRVSIDLDDGRRVSYIHLSQINAHVGQRIGRGQLDWAYSGASGQGSDWYYGPHVHVSLWERPGMSYRDTIDFQPFVGEDTDMPLNPADKSVIKDAMFEFYRDVGDPPSGYADWTFFRHAVWEQPITAQDTEGHPVLGTDGEPLRFSASGYLASTNAQVADIRDPDDGPPPTRRRRRRRDHPLELPAYIGGFFLGIIGLIEVLRFVWPLL